MDHPSASRSRTRRKMTSPSRSRRREGRCRRCRHVPRETSWLGDGIPSGKVTVGPWKSPIFNGLTSLPSPMTARVYVNLPEFIWQYVDESWWFMMIPCNDEPRFQGYRFQQNQRIAMCVWISQDSGVQPSSAIKDQTDQTSMGWNDQVFLQPLHVAFIGISIMRQINPPFHFHY